MASAKTLLDEEDFPLLVKDTTLTTRDGELVATVQTQALAEDLARRLNEDASRRQEGVWSA